MKARILLIMLVAAMMFAACKGKSSGYEFVNNKSASSAAADSVAIADTNKVVQKLVKTAEINFKVKDVRQTGENISALTTQYGGMVMHHQVQSSPGSTKDVHISNDSIMRIAAFNTTGEMTVKIPSDKLEDFLTKVGHMSIYVNVSKMDIEDRSLDYLSAQLKLKDRQELVNQQKTGKIRIKNPTDVLLLKDDMVDQKISNLRTNDQVKYSVIGLNFYQSDMIVKEMIANDDPSAYDIPFFQRFTLAVESGWSIFVDLVIGLANIWVFILTGILVWRGIVYYRKKVKMISTPSA